MSEPVAPLSPQKPDAATFGAPFQNADAVTDPETELAAEQYNRLVDQVVMSAQVTRKAWVRCTYTGGTFSVADHDAVWGATEAVKPTPARTGLGVYTVSWAGAYQGLDTSVTPAPTRAVQIRAASASAYAAAGARIVNVRRVSAVQIEARTYDQAGAAADVDELLVEAL